MGKAVARGLGHWSICLPPTGSGSGSYLWFWLLRHLLRQVGKEVARRLGHLSIYFVRCVGQLAVIWLTAAARLGELGRVAPRGTGDLGHSLGQRLNEDGTPTERN